VTNSVKVSHSFPLTCDVVISTLLHYIELLVLYLNVGYIILKTSKNSKTSVVRRW